MISTIYECSKDMLLLSANSEKVSHSLGRDHYLVQLPGIECSNDDDYTYDYDFSAASLTRNEGPEDIPLNDLITFD